MNQEETLKNEKLPEIKDKKGILNNVPPKFTFVFGLVLGLAVISTITSIVLFGNTAEDGEAINNSNSAKVAGVVTNSAPTPTPPADPTPVQINLREVTNEDHIRGNKDASVKLVEYSDLECPFCKRFHPTMQQLLQEYDGKVAWVYRHFPLASLHPKAPKEAEATECVNELGGNDKFWEYLDKLFEVTPSNNGLPEEELPKLAEEIGIDKTKFEECLSSGRYTQYVQNDYNDATNAGARGTPYTVIIDSDGRKQAISGALPYDQVKSVVDNFLQ